MVGRPTLHRRAALVVAGLLALATSAFAETALFVDSAPILAEVTINGTAYGTTPLLVRGLAPGAYEVQVMKPGHAPAAERFELVEGEVRAVRLRPQPNLFIATFSADETIVEGKPIPRRDGSLLVPAGTYRFDSERDGLRLTPFYPNDGALIAARITTLAAGTAALLATVEDLLVGDARSYFTSYLPSPATFAVWTVTAAAGGFWIGLATDKRAYEQRTIVRPFSGSLTPAQAERFFLDGEAALAAGNLSRALSGYSRVYAEGGDSEYLPVSLYKSARIYSVSGDTELATRLLELLVRDYPAPELYDRSLKSLADAYVALGAYDDAIDRLESMVFFDPLYEKVDVERDIAEIRRLQQEDGP